MIETTADYPREGDRACAAEHVLGPHGDHDLALAVSRAEGATSNAWLAAVADRLGLTFAELCRLGVHRPRYHPEDLEDVDGADLKRLRHADDIAAVPVIRSGRVVGIGLVHLATGGRRVLAGSAEGRHVAFDLARRLARRSLSRTSLVSAAGGAA